MEEILGKIAKCNPISIIESLGGINHVVTLCLTHPDSIKNEQYLQSALSSIESIIQTTTNDHKITTTLTDKTIINMNKLTSISTADVNTDTDISEIIIYEDVDDTVTTTNNTLNTNKNGNIPTLVLNNSVSQLQCLTNINTINCNKQSQFAINLQSQSTCTASNSNMSISNDKMVIVYNKHEFYQSFIVLKANRYNNLLNKCRCLCLNKNNDNLMNNLWFNTTMMIIVSCLIDIAATIWFYMIGEDLIYYMLEILFFLIIICIGIIAMLSMNIIVTKIVMNTFDFWFKLWNSILGEICYMWLSLYMRHDGGSNATSKDRYMFGNIVDICAILVAFCILFLFDAIPIKRNIKRTITFIAVLLNTCAGIWIYFKYDDVHYDPFDKYNFDYTRISIKSLLLGSYGNMILFIAKPIFGDIYRFCLNNYKSKSGSGLRAHDHDRDIHNDKKKTMNLEKLMFVHKRPKIQWYNES